MIHSFMPPLRLGLLLVLCFLCCLWFGACNPSRHLSNPRHAADEFFLKIGENRFQEAYDDSAFCFQAQTSFKSFQANTKELGLTAGTLSCKWTREEIKSRDIKMTGEVMSANGNEVSVIVTLIQERGAWRVVSLRTPGLPGTKEEDRFTLLGKGDAFTSSANTEPPNPETAQKLIVGALGLFNTAIQTRDFRTFYSKVSVAWQNQLTENQLKRAFQPFIDAKVNIGSLEGLQAVFDQPPSINSEGILLLVGHYDTKPYVTSFVLRFAYEFPQWKLYGVEVQIRN